MSRAGKSLVTLMAIRCAASATPLVPSAVRAQDLPIRHWLVRGPVLADTGATGVLRDYLGGEERLLPDSGETAAGGPFMPVDADSLGGINLNRVFRTSTDWSAAYAHAFVFSPADRTLLLVMDSDDDLVAWLNGQRVWVNVVARGLGTDRDTVTVRLAAGWNSLLLKAINRTGGFGVLGRLAPTLGEGGLDGVRTQARRPPELLAQTHGYPAATVTAAALRIGGQLTWNGDALEGQASVSVSAWGPDTLRGVSVRFVQGATTWSGDTIGALAPSAAATLRFRPTFAELARAALGEAPLRVLVAWRGGARDAALAVDPDQLLRLVGARLSLGSWVVDSSAEFGLRLQTHVVVPAMLARGAVDLLAAEFGPRARFTVNGRWAASREGTIELCAPCNRGDTLAIAIVLEPGRAWRSFPVARLREAGYAEYADGYDYARQLAGRAPEIARPEPREWLAALAAEDGRTYDALSARYRTAYAPLSSEIRRDTLHLVGNSHIDAAWLWPWSETIDVIRNTWRTSLRLAAMFPGYVFAGSAAAYYDAMDRLEPTLADSLRAAVDGGQWALIGGWWVEPDQNLPSGESLARQGLYGQRYFQRRYGRRARVAWTPDSFGYPWTLPQIYRLSGLDAFVTQKIRWNDSTQLPYNAFFWEGRDGTRIFSYNPYGYDHDLAPRRLIRERLEDRRRTGGHHQIVLYGVGDHGGGPTIEMLQRAEDLRRVPTFPVLRHAHPDSALGTLRRSQPESAFPVWRDELYLEYHRGTYTTQARQKWWLRRSESFLRTAEALAAFDTAAYPRAQLESVWRRVLFNQFHDILPGSSIRQVYVDADAEYRSAWNSLDTAMTRGFAGLRARLDTRARDRAVPVVVFNALPWVRGGLVSTEEANWPPQRFFDRDIFGWGGFYARDVPALGARVYLLSRPEPSSDSRLPEPAVGANWLENAFLRVELDTATGTITRIFDKRNRREVLAPGARGNVLELFGDRPRTWDAWDIGYTGERLEVTATRMHPSRQDRNEVRVAFTRSFGGSTMRQELVLARESPYLDVLNEVDWHETRKLLKVGFALNVAADSATCEIPYGTIGRAGKPRTQAERAKYEFPCQRWVDASDSTYGVSMLTDSKYGWDYHGNVLRLSLLRAPLWPDSTADRGQHRFRFAIYPHAGDWRAAETVRRAAEYNTPLVGVVEEPHPGRLGRSVSFASVDVPNVELAWVKRAEDSDDLVLRLVEWHGRPATATVTLQPRVRSARRANLLEDPGEALPTTAHAVRVTLRPYEIATVLVDVAR